MNAWGPVLAGAALLVLPGPPALRRIGAALPARRGPRGAIERAVRALRGGDVAAAAAGLAVAALVGGVPGAAAGCAAAGAGAVLLRRRARRTVPDDPLAVAAGLDLLAACLRSGMAMAPAVDAAAGVCAPAPGGGGAADAAPALAAALRRVADLLALGGEPQEAWLALADEPGLEPIARMARRSAESGASLAREADDLARAFRAGAADAAVASAERASVAVAGPLGVCFLPAFVCLGIAPVIVGLAGGILGGGALP